jgi:hypothetical protein
MVGFGTSCVEISDSTVKNSFRKQEMCIETSWKAGS